MDSWRTPECSVTTDARHHAAICSDPEESRREPLSNGKECRNWSVWRQDDNANTFLVQANLTESEALMVVREYEARGHKQFYWVRKDAKNNA